MADNNGEGRINVDNFDFAGEGANDDTPMVVTILLLGKIALYKVKFNNNFMLMGLYLLTNQEERDPVKSLGETSKRGLSTAREGENPYQELWNLLLEDSHPSRRRGHAQHQEPPSKEKERNKSPDESMEEDVAPQRRQAQRSPTSTKGKRSPHSPPHGNPRMKRRNQRRKGRERGHPLLHLHHRLLLRMKVVDIPQRNHQGEDIEDHMLLGEDKVLAFIQRFDAVAIGDEGFTESSKLRQVAMHFQKSAKQWWASLWANGEAPRTLKNLRASIMKQFLSSDAKDKVLTEWQSLKLSPYESIHKYVEKFWDLHLKATVYKKIDFEEQKQQFYAGLLEDMNEYVNSQRPKSNSAVIQHTMVAARIDFQQGAKRNLKPMEMKKKHDRKGKNHPQNSCKGTSSSNKAKEKGVYKGKNRLTLEDLEHYHKDNRCFKCGEQGHPYRTCPQRNARNEQPRASIIEAPKEDVHCKGSSLSYAWGKLANKLGIQDFKMRDAMKADGAFLGQDVSVTPLIGKLRLHIQGYVDKEDFFVSPLKHEDVILGAPWFDRLAASISDVNKTQVKENGMHEDLELSKFLNRFQDFFIDNTPEELPQKRGDDDHAIELLPGSSPCNKPPYRVSQDQQEEIMTQVNELVDKEMARPSSSPFCSPILLEHKKDGTYRMCADYRALNRITIKNRFLVPRIEDLFDKLQESTYFSRIDLKGGYHQIRIVDEDILKTAFCTTFGLCEYLVMPFGLTNAPKPFNRMMERIF
ncbi:hypothetical protein L7F22_026929 [Adiantum nelumboides]|nr:hypothetical protein [Adiantum nelumboides]